MVLMAVCLSSLYTKFSWGLTNHCIKNILINNHEQVQRLLEKYEKKNSQIRGAVPCTIGLKASPY